MKYLIAAYCVGTVLLASSGLQAQPSTMRLKGKLVNMKNPVELKYNGAASLLGDSKDILLYANAEGLFDTIVPLAKPEFYSIRRNTLYLTPGDNLEVYITDNSHEATFKGKGAEANEYMKYRLFPKGGSFLESGKMVRKDFLATKKVIDSLAAVRRRQLNALKDVSPIFKDLEGARITADVINSYLLYPTYGRAAYKDLSKEEAAAKTEKFFLELSPEINRLMKEIAADKYLDVAVVRDVLDAYADAAKAEFFKGVLLSPRTKELYEAAAYTNALKGEVNNEIIVKTQTYAAGVKNPDFEVEVNAKLKQLALLIKGNPAIDIELQDSKGNSKNLSDFKGKVLYIDLWATWCGSCIQEAPAFAALSEKYKEKDIVFLQVSTDSQTKPWLNYLEKKGHDLPQYISFDSRLKTAWAIFYIPRFLLIDKNFKIIDAYAKRPLEEGVEKMLNQALDN